METQPLIRSNPLKPAASSVASSGGQTGGFDRQLQDQMRQSEASPETGTGERVEVVCKPVRQTSEAGEPVAVPDEVEATENMLVDIAGLLSGSPVEELVLPVSDTGEPVLDADGNVLPLAGDKTGNDLPWPAVIISLPQTGLSSGASLEQEALAGLLLDADAVPDVALRPLSLLASASEASTTEAAPVLPVLEPDLLSDMPEMTAEKQLAAAMADMSKPVSVSLHQVQAITGSAAAHVQSWVPPQLDALQSSGSVLSNNINLPVNHPAWGQQVGEQLAFMIHGKLQSAEIKLNPAHLGPLEIRVQLQDDQASVTFVSTHAPVREALDAALPRLRDMLEQQGLNLAHVDVSAHSGSERETSSRSSGSHDGVALDDEAVSQERPQIAANTSIASGLSVFV